MKVNATIRRAALVIAICAVAVGLLPAPAATATNWTEGLLPPKTSPQGNLDPRLAALWYQWIFLQRAVDVQEAGAPDGVNNTHPVLDKTGTYAAVGQENGIGPGNKYFFLAGTFGGSATRTVTVPQGKTLFFPIINVQIDNAVDPMPDPKLVAHETCEMAAAFIDGNEVVQSATVDGQPLATWRVQSMPFAYRVLEADSVYDYFGLVGPQFEGTVAPSCTDGYWAVLEPLAPGQHVLAFHASDKTGFALDVTYYLTVP
jgi:hypothetical protein